MFSLFYNVFLYVHNVVFCILCLKVEGVALCGVLSSLSSLFRCPTFLF